MTTKVTREQLKVLEDAYKLEELISEGPECIAFGTRPRPDWAKALNGDAFNAATKLEKELVKAAGYAADPYDQHRPKLYEITREALGLANSDELQTLYCVWTLIHQAEYITTQLVYLRSMARMTAKDLGQEYDETALDDAIELVGDPWQAAEEWRDIVEQRFVETGSARPAGEGAK